MQPRSRILPLALLATGAAALAAPPSFLGIAGGFQVPHTFVAGERAMAEEVNENFQAVADALDAIPRPESLVVVAHEGGDFDSVAAALASVTGATADSRVTVWVAPGEYVETDLCTVPAFVTLAGAGTAATRVTSLRNSPQPSPDAATVRLDEGGELRSLTIANDWDGANQAMAVFGASHTRDTRMVDVVAEALQSGGSARYGVYLLSSDLVLKDCVLRAEGASSVSSALVVVDDSGPFSQPWIDDCLLEATDPNSGRAMSIVNTAATVTDSTLVGWEIGISASIAGISRLFGSQVETLNLEPVFETTGSASIVSATTAFSGGNPSGLSSAFKYVWCSKGNGDPIDNGVGSAVQ